jgi:hypothetical protein
MKAHRHGGAGQGRTETLQTAGRLFDNSRYAEVGVQNLLNGGKNSWTVDRDSGTLHRLGRFTRKWQRRLANTTIDAIAGYRAHSINFAGHEALICECTKGNINENTN